MRSTEESWEAFKARMKEDYRAAIETALSPSQQTLDNYRYSGGNQLIYMC